MNARPFVSIAVSLAVWSPASRASVLSEIMEISERLAQSARGIVECDKACREVGEAAGKLSLRVKGRVAMHAITQMLDRDFPQIFSSKSQSVLQKNEYHGLSESFVGTARDLIHAATQKDLAESLGSMSRFYHDSLPPRIAGQLLDDSDWLETHRALFRLAAIKILTKYDNEMDSIGLYALAITLDDGKGEFTKFAKEMMGLSHALSGKEFKQIKLVATLIDGKFMPELKRQMSELSDEFADAALSRDRSHYPKQLLSEASAGVEKIINLERALAKSGLNLNLLTLSNTVHYVRLIEQYRSVVIQAIKSGNHPETDTGLLHGLVLTWNISVRDCKDAMAILIHRNPDLADSDLFDRMMKDPQFVRFAETVLLR